MTSQALISKIHCMLSANQKRHSQFNVLLYNVKVRSKRRAKEDFIFYVKKYRDLCESLLSPFKTPHSTRAQPNNVAKFTQRTHSVELES